MTTMLEMSEEMVGKQVRGRYTQEYKAEAVLQIQAGQSLSVTAQVLGIPKATLGNWVRLAAKGQLTSAGQSQKPPVVTPEQMKMTRLRAEVACLTMERDIEKKRRRTLRWMSYKVRPD